MLIASAESLKEDGGSTSSPCKEYAKGLLVKTCVPNSVEGWGRPNIGMAIPTSRPQTQIPITGGARISVTSRPQTQIPITGGARISVTSRPQTQIPITGGARISVTFRP
jgi:hypothetical protein